MKIALLIEYDGTDFSGWQVQPGIRTVQGELEAALAKLNAEPVGLMGCGRTDAGVHAKGLVAHADIIPSQALPIWKLTDALNALTGEDIVIREIREVPDDFHARFSALERGYRYRISRKKIALERNYCWQFTNAFDEQLLQEVAALLPGEHDFTSFSKQTEDVTHFRCTITRSEFVWVGDEIHFWISANRFVRGMVRALTGAIVETAKGKITIDEFTRLLNEPLEHDRAKYMAPAHGLTFWNASYPKEYGLW